MASKLASVAKDLGLNFTDVKPGAGTDPVPTDWYWLEVTRWSETKSGDGSKAPGTLMYKVQLIIKDGPHKGRRIRESFYMGGEMAETNLGRMRGLAVACGVPEDEVMDEDWDPTDEWAEKNLIGQSCDGKVTYQPEKGDYDEGNQVRKYREHEFTNDDLLNA